MAKRTTKKKKSNAVGIGVAITAAAVAAAGAYFLYGSKNAAKNRKKIKGWTLQAKGEVLEQMERIKNLSQEDYERLVDRVMTRYRRVGSAAAPEVAKLARELKGHWKHLVGTKVKKKRIVKKKAVRKTTKRKK